VAEATATHNFPLPFEKVNRIGGASNLNFFTKKMRKSTVVVLLFIVNCHADEFSNDSEQQIASDRDGQVSGSRTVFAVEHSLGAEGFSPRATLAITTSSLSSAKSAKFLEAGKFSSADVAAFKRLAQAGGFYRIRVQSVADDTSSPYVVAALPACQLFLAGFKEKLVLRFDLEGGISAIEYANPHFPGDCVKRLTANSKAKGSIRIRSAATIVVPEEAPSPPLRISGNMFVKGAEQIIAGEKKAPPQKSFFQRYWHIIVPVGILFMLSNALAPAPPGGQGGGSPPAKSS